MVQTRPRSLDSFPVGTSNPWLNMHAKLTLTFHFMPTTVTFGDAIPKADIRRDLRSWWHFQHPTPEFQGPLTDDIVREEDGGEASVARG